MRSLTLSDIRNYICPPPGLIHPLLQRLGLMQRNDDHDHENMTNETASMTNETASMTDIDDLNDIHMDMDMEAETCMEVEAAVAHSTHVHDDDGGCA